jgi:hypothetical protein
VTTPAQPPLPSVQSGGSPDELRPEQPQELVAVRQRGRRPGGSTPSRQRRQRIARRPHPQRRQPRPLTERQVLHQELDVGETAAAELEIEPVAALVRQLALMRARSRPISAAMSAAGGVR